MPTTQPRRQVLSQYLLYHRLLFYGQSPHRQPHTTIGLGLSVTLSVLQVCTS